MSSERPSNHARFDSTSEQPITKRLESATVVGTWGQHKRKSTVGGANLKKKRSSRAKSLRKKCIRNKSNMRGKGITRRGIRSKNSSNFTEQLNLSIEQVGSASLSKGVKQPTPVTVNALGYTLGDTGQSHALKPLEGLARKSMQTPQSLTTDQEYSTSSLKAKFAHEASATEVEISDTVQNLRKDKQKKRRRLILTDDDDDEEEEDKAEDFQQENVNNQPLKCNEPMVKHQINTEYYVEGAVQTGDINDQNLINGRPMKRRRRYIVENEYEEDIEGDESALNNASKWSANDSAKMASQTPVATDHSLQSRPSDSECADRQYHICLHPLDEPVWSGFFKIENKVFLKLDAHLSNKACQRVHELSGLLQPVVEVRTLSQLQAWPERWISSGPTDESIGQNEDLTRLNRIIKSDDALQVTVGIVELLIFPSVLLPKQYHLFQGKQYLWGVFGQRKDILDNAVHVEEQDGSVNATGEGQHQEHNLLDQQDEALYELSDNETFAVKHIVDAEDQLQVEGNPELQNDTMKDAMSSSWSPAGPEADLKSERSELKKFQTVARSLRAEGPQFEKEPAQPEQVLVQVEDRLGNSAPNAQFTCDNSDARPEGAHAAQLLQVPVQAEGVAKKPEQVHQCPPSTPSSRKGTRSLHEDQLGRPEIPQVGGLASTHAVDEACVPPIRIENLEELAQLTEAVSRAPLVRIEILEELPQLIEAVYRARWIFSHFTPCINP